jgi:hypothetical protein
MSAGVRDAPRQAEHGIRGLRRANGLTLGGVSNPGSAWAGSRPALAHVGGSFAGVGDGASVPVFVEPCVGALPAALPTRSEAHASSGCREADDRHAPAAVRGRTTNPAVVLGAPDHPRDARRAALEPVEARLSLRTHRRRAPGGADRHATGPAGRGRPCARRREIGRRLLEVASGARDGCDSPGKAGGCGSGLRQHTGESAEAGPGDKGRSEP